MGTTCIILAGGLGTRLKQAVPDKPKCLAPVGIYSFLDIQLHLLRAQGITDFILSLGYMADLVCKEIEHLKNNFSIRYVIERQALGTGGATLFAMDTFQIDEALITNGDTFLNGNLVALLTPLELKKGELCKMAVVKVPDISRFGEIKMENGTVRSFAEKGGSGPGLINAGFYRANKQAFEKYGFRAGDTFSFESNLMPQLAKNSEVAAAIIEGDFTDIGVPEDYHKFCSDYGSKFRFQDV